MSNFFHELLQQKAEERFSVDALDMSNSDWICKNTTLKKRPFSFEGYEFQKKIVDDLHPDMSVIKISQVGLTEVQIRKALAFLLRNRGTSLIFSLPNDEMFERVSKGRVKPIVHEDRVFNTNVGQKEVRSTEMMQFGQSFLYLVPAVESAATSIAADVVFNDEVDLSDQKMITLFNSRLQNSKFKIKQKFSTPSFPSYGIDLNWQTSDQHLYLCRCDACGHWNHPEFDPRFIHLPGMPDVKDLTEITSTYIDVIDLKSAYVKCEKCHKPLDLASPEKREWVPMFGNRSSRGYRIGCFTTANLGLPYIFTTMWDYQKNEFIRGFHNTVLGKPYSDGTIQIPLEALKKCFTQKIFEPDLKTVENLWVGIDMGQICHVTLGSGTNEDNVQVIAMYTKHVKDIVSHCRDLAEKYNLRGGCVDRHPYEPTAREIFEATNGLISPVEYRGLKDVNIVENEFKEYSHAQVQKTWFLDKIAGRIRKGTITFSGYGEQQNIITEHFRDMVREEDKTKPDKPAVWTKLSGNDHYFHSAAFMNLAPHLAHLRRFHSKEDNRTMTLTSIISVGDNTSNLIGISNKRLDGNYVFSLG